MEPLARQTFVPCQTASCLPLLVHREEEIFGIQYMCVRITVSMWCVVSVLMHAAVASSADGEDTRMEDAEMCLLENGCAEL